MVYDEVFFGRKGFRADKRQNDKKHDGNTKKGRYKRWQIIEREFRCAHCRQMVFPTGAMGTVHRNHCPWCLHSLHVDTKPGNRASDCHARMEPVGLTCKHNGFDKYGRARDGDIMLVHVCTGCGTININRIAGDDCCDKILEIFRQSLSMPPPQKKIVENTGITLLQTEDATRLHTALFGRKVV